MQFWLELHLGSHWGAYCTPLTFWVNNELLCGRKSIWKGEGKEQRKRSREGGDLTLWRSEKSAVVVRVTVLICEGNWLFMHVHLSQFIVKSEPTLILCKLNNFCEIKSLLFRQNCAIWFADYNDVLKGSTHFPVIYGLGEQLNIYTIVKKRTPMTFSNNFNKY